MRKELGMLSRKELGMLSMDSIGRCVALAVAAMAFTAGGARAAVLYTSHYDSGGFEAPRFVATQALEGSDLPAPAGNGQWFKVGGAATTAVVQTNNPKAGLQTIRVDRNGVDGLWGVPAPAAAGSVTGIRVDVDLRVDVAPDLTHAGPRFGLAAYDSTSGVKLIGGGAIDASSGAVLYRQAGTGAWAATGTFVGREGQYNHLALAIDYVAKTYALSLDGVLLRTEGFVDNTATAFSDAPIVALDGGNGGLGIGRAYFDNYAIAAAVPEPATLAALALGGAILGRRRRPR